MLRKAYQYDINGKKHIGTPLIYFIGIEDFVLTI